MAIKRKTRMYEPWGYVDENNYQGAETILDNDLESFFAQVEYKRDDNKIHFANKDGEEKATLDVSEFVKSDSIVEKAWYEDGKIYVKFTNGDVITVDVEELIDQNEFSDGLQVNEGIVSVLIDGESEAFLSVSGNGVKVSGVQDAIDAERDRAISAETALDEKIEQEIVDRKADVDEEEARAISAETALDEKIDAEITRATEAEEALDAKIDAEIERAEAAEQALDEKIEQEIADRKADVDEEEARATAAEEALQTALTNEITRATQTEQALDNKISTLSDNLASEVTRAQAAEQELSTRLTTEVAERKADVDEEEARAIAAEEALDAKIDQEIADRINAVENEKEARESADNRLQEAITSEVSRATEAETQLNNKIDQEIDDRAADVDAEEARAIAAEQALDEKIEAETARATSAETTLQNNIDEEKTARINRDTELTGLIEAEVVTARREETRIESKLDAEIADREADVDVEEARAIAAEQALDGKIDQEIADRKAEAVASAEYVKDDVKIYLKNDNGETLSEIDCTDFIVDGMIEDIELVKSGNTSVLVITWNTDGGSKKTTIDVGDIFEADNYYTKAEIDGTVEGINDAIAEEAATARAAEEANADAISAEKTRATGAEGNLQTAINDEATARADADTALQTAITAEQTRAEGAEGDLQTAINGEATARADADTALQTAITAEQTRAEGAESDLNDAIAAEATTARAAEQANASAIAEEEAARIAADETQDAVIATKADSSAVTESIAAEEARATEAENDILDAIDSLDGIKFDDVAYDSSAKTINFIANGNVVKDLDATPFIKDGMIDDVKIEGGNLVIIFNTDSGKEEIDIPLTDIFDPSNYYTKEEVDALLLAKENEIYNLTKIVGDMGGAVTYNLPNEAGKSFNTLMGNNGTVKLTDDVTTGRFGPGITAKNDVKLNLNNHNLNVTGLTTSSAQAAIMARGTQEITIGGKGTIDAGGGICIEGNGADSVINLTGSTTVYQTDRSGGELIYCYTGTINITNGTFRNNGEDKKFMLNCYDANYRAGTAKIVVTGGKFYDFDPGNNTAEGPDTSFLAEGYHTEASTVVEEGVEHTVYTVKKD